MTYIVRRIRPGEGIRLKQLRLRALRDAPDAFAITLVAEAAKPDDWWESLAERGAQGATQVVVVAEGDDCELVAVAGGFIEAESNRANLVAMWTSPRARRQGIAWEMMAAVKAWAYQAGAEELHLWVTVGNEPALELYESAGFRSTGDSEPLPSNPSKVVVRMCLGLGEASHPVIARVRDGH